MTDASSSDELPSDRMASSNEGQPPLRPMSILQIVYYCVANLGYGAFFTLNNAVIPLFLKQFTHNNIILGLMGSSHSFEGAIIQPIVGSLSDRLKSPLGRRRPFMLIFIPLSVLFLLITPAAGHLPDAVRLPGVILIIFLFTVFFNIAQDPYQALLADLAPEEQRGRVMGVWQFVLAIGMALIPIVSLKVYLSYPMQFYFTAALMLVTTAITCTLIREKSHIAKEEKKTSHLRNLQQAIEGLRTLKQAKKFLLAYFCYGVGVGAIFPFLTLFVVKIAHVTDKRALSMFLVLMVATLAGSLPFGWLTDRIGPSRTFTIALVLIAIASLNGLWVTNLTQIAIVFSIAGLGNAAQSAAGYPLLTDLVPAEEVGFYTGLQSTALSIAAPFTAVITGWLINNAPGGYRLIFGVCSVSVMIALAILLSVRPKHGPEEIAARKRELRSREGTEHADASA